MDKMSSFPRVIVSASQPHHLISRDLSHPACVQWTTQNGVSVAWPTINPRFGASRDDAAHLVAIAEGSDLGGADEGEIERAAVRDERERLSG